MINKNIFFSEYLTKNGLYLSVIILVIINSTADKKNIFNDPWNVICAKNKSPANTFWSLVI